MKQKFQCIGDGDSAFLPWCSEFQNVKACKPSEIDSPWKEAKILSNLPNGLHKWQTSGTRTGTLY